MSAWRTYSLAVVAVGGLILTGCGGSMFRSAKIIADPLALNGRIAEAATTVGGDSLTASLSAQGNLEYSFGNPVASAAPYEGLESVTLSQSVRLRLVCEPNASMPGSITLRNVSMGVRLRIADSDTSGVSRQFPTIQLNYSGTLTLTREADGSYVANVALPFSTKLGKSEGETLLAILAGGEGNTMSVEAELRAETARNNMPDGATVTLFIQFDNSSAYVEW